LKAQSLEYPADAAYKQLLKKHSIEHKLSFESAGLLKESLQNELSLIADKSVVTEDSSTYIDTGIFNIAIVHMKLERGIEHRQLDEHIAILENLRDHTSVEYRFENSLDVREELFSIVLLQMMLAALCLLK